MDKSMAIEFGPPSNGYIVPAVTSHLNMFSSCWVAEWRTLLLPLIIFDYLALSQRVCWRKYIIVLKLFMIFFMLSYVFLLVGVNIVKVSLK